MIMFKGFGLGFGLIAAIGAQNAFVLSQGIKKEFNIIIPILCLIFDAILISIGVAGVGSFLMSSSILSKIATIGGVLFLFVYGLKSFISVFTSSVMDVEAKEVKTLKAVITTTLAITFLNPHAYLDTVVLIGSVSTQYEGINRILFGLGAIISSAIWFFSLSLGGGILSPLFKKTIAWKILDGFVGCMMWFICYGLLKSGL